MLVDEIQELRALGALDVFSTLSGSKNNIGSLTHPEYNANLSNWVKWRLVKKSGQDFIEEYLERFSSRESDADFNARKNVSYVPAFAKAGLNDIKNAIFQRISDVTREGGVDTYQEAILGHSGGVDLKGSTMNSYVGRVVLPELLAIGKIGIFVDMPEIRGASITDKGSSRPYLYSYVAEDILNWSVDFKAEGAEFKSLLLRDHIYETMEGLPLPLKYVERYRLMWVDGGVTFVQFFNDNSEPIDRFGNSGVDIIVLDLPSIPFVLFELSESLLCDVANYQIALLNLESSDIMYSLKSNFPFYVEQYDPRSENVFLRRSEGATIVKSGTADQSEIGENREIKVGVAAGRRIPKGLEYPEFRHPSSEPLKASMEKQEKLKRDIRMLINLAVSNITPKMASAESKDYDERTLEAGLSYIGLELEHGERNIAKFWTWYENKSSNIATVIYPKKYKIKTDSDKRAEAEKILETAEIVPSVTYKKEALKKAVALNIGTEVSNEVLEKIYREIDEADVLFSDPETLSKDIEQGLINIEAASKAKAYPEGSVEKARQDHADRLKRIAESQGQARGVSDLGGMMNASRAEKQDMDMKGTVPQDATRGEGE